VAALHCFLLLSCRISVCQEFQLQQTSLLTSSLEEKTCRSQATLYVAKLFRFAGSSRSARIYPRAHHIEEPIAAVPIAAELDADRPVGVVELGLFRRGEIPIANDIEIRRGFALSRRTWRADDSWLGSDSFAPIGDLPALTPEWGGSVTLRSAGIPTLDVRLHPLPQRCY